MKKLMISMALVLPTLLMTSCSSDDDNGVSTPPVEISKTYQLASVAEPSISGTAKFIKNTDNSVTIELQLVGTPDGGMHPAHIHNGNATEMGTIALDLETVNGDTGFSTTTIRTLNNGSVINYEQLIDFDGYINVHLSADQLTTLVAQGDIGQNELTGTRQSYNLSSVSNPAISGTVMFSQRVNNEALAVIQLEGTTEGILYPAHIHMGSVATAPGSIAFSFGWVDGSTGMAIKNVSMLDFGDTDASNDEPINYSELVAYDGYVNVHNPEPIDLSVLVAQGDIGAND